MILVLRGPCAIYTGYGKLFLNVVERMASRFPVEVLALDNRVPDGYPIPITQVPKGTQFGLLVGPGDKIGQLPTKYRILYTMYEASDIPRSWQQELSIADEVWVPSTFCQEVFSCYLRTRIVPIGYDERVYHRRDWTTDDREHFWRNHCPEAIGKRVIGIAGVMSKRKGIDILLWAWEKAELEDTVLVVKTRDTRSKLPPIPPSVYVIEEDWPDATMAAFYRSIDLFVLPTRGEGAGLLPLEAAACGTPAFVTRATGPADYIDDRGIYGIDVRGTSPATNIHAERAEWVEPDPLVVLDILRGFAQNRFRVEHQYRQWSWAALANVWEAELRAAKGRAR